MSFRNSGLWCCTRLYMGKVTKWNSFVKNRKGEKFKLYPLSPLYMWPITAWSGRDCWVVGFGKLLDAVAPIPTSERCGGRSTSTWFDSHWSLYTQITIKLAALNFLMIFFFPFFLLFGKPVHIIQSDALIHTVEFGGEGPALRGSTQRIWDERGVRVIVRGVRF